MVFENVFANLLNTYLSAFIDDLSSKQLNLGVWSGKKRVYEIFKCNNEK